MFAGPPAAGAMKISTEHPEQAVSAISNQPAQQVIAHHGLSRKKAAVMAGLVPAIHVFSSREDR